MNLTFESLLHAPLDIVWEKTTDFDFVVNLNRPFFILLYDKKKFSPKVKENYEISSKQYIFGFLPFGTWGVKVIEWQPHKYFIDIATESPLKNFRHTHIYERAQNNTTKYIDCLDFEPGVLGPIAVYFIKLVFNNRHKNLRSYFNSNNQ